MYSRGGQNSGAGGLSTNNPVIPQATGQVNNSIKPNTDYTGGYGANYS